MFKKFDNFWFYSSIFGLYIILNYLSPSDPSIPEKPIIELLIFSPIIEELLFRLFLIGLSFIFIENLFDENVNNFSILFLLTTFALTIGLYTDLLLIVELIQRM